MYLSDFADNLRRLGVSASSEKERKRLNEFSRGCDEFEKVLHNDFFVQWKISVEDSRQMPNTLLYTSYMKRVVTTRSHKQGLAALLPCYWVYLHIGKCMLKLREELGEW